MSQPIVRRPKHVLWGVGFALASATMVVSAFADGETNVNSRCKATSVCGNVPAAGGACTDGTDACCCRIGAAGAYACACHTAEFCQSPGSGNTCDDSASN